MLLVSPSFDEHGMSVLVCVCVYKYKHVSASMLSVDAPSHSHCKLESAVEGREREGVCFRRQMFS